MCSCGSIGLRVKEGTHVYIVEGLPAAILASADSPEEAAVRIRSVCGSLLRRGGDTRGVISKILRTSFQVERWCERNVDGKA